MKKHTIPVLFAGDDNCVMTTCVVITSIMENKNDDTFYDFYIMHPGKYSIFSKIKINQLKRKYKDLKITFINMKNEFKTAYKAISYITNPTYYRLLASEYLPQLDKIIYLDSDIIVNCDLSEMYNNDLGEKIVAGVKHPAYCLKELLKEGYINEMKGKYNFTDFSQYINAGVILLNLKEIRKNNMSALFKELVDLNPPTVDQDVLNVACFNKILHLPLKYNVMNKTKSMISHPLYKNFFNCEEAIKAHEAPAIIHWAGLKKPWETCSTEYYNQWEKYYKLSNVYDENLIKKLKELKETQIKISEKYLLKLLDSNCFKENSAEIIEQLKDKKVLIYGAGIVFQKIKNLYPLQDLNIVAIADMKFHKERLFEGFKAIPPHLIKNEDYDVILITLENVQPIIEFLHKTIKINEDIDFLYFFKPKIEDEQSSINYLEKINFEKQLTKLNKKYKNKSIIIYSAGNFFQVINKYFDLSKLNIIGLCDKSFNNEKDEEFLGYKTYNLTEIKKLNPDFILVAAQDVLNTIYDLEQSIIKNSKIKIRTLIKKPFKDLWREIFN